MKIKWNKVTWYSKTLALLFLIVLPFVGFYAGIKYQSAISPNVNTLIEANKKDIDTKTDVQVDTTKKDINTNNDTTNLTDTNKNTNLSCGKATIQIINYLTSEEKALEYFAKNNLQFDPRYESSIVNTNLLNVGKGNDNYWIAKLREDGIAKAMYDNVGCDFRD